MTQFQDDVQIDGNLRVGDDPGATNAVVEAHRAGTSTGKPKRGLQVGGEVVNEDNLVNALEWSVHELNLGGSGGKTLGEASALRTALNLDGNQNLNTGIGLDVQVGQKVGATGLSIAPFLWPEYLPSTKMKRVAERPFHICPAFRATL